MLSIRTFSNHSLGQKYPRASHGFVPVASLRQFVIDFVFARHKCKLIIRGRRHGELLGCGKRTRGADAVRGVPAAICHRPPLTRTCPVAQSHVSWNVGIVPTEEASR